MSRHHYEDFYTGRRRRDPMIPVSYLIRLMPLRGVARHRVVDGFKPAMSRTIKENRARREKMALNAAEMCVKAVEAMRRGHMFNLEGFI